MDAGPSLPLEGRGAPARRYSPFAAWSSVAILLMLAILSILDRQIIALQVGPMKADLGLTDTQLGMLQGIAFGLLYAIAGIPLGWAVDRFPRRIIAYLGVTLWSLSAASCGLATNFWQLFAGRTLVGVGEATLNPTAVSLISDLFPRAKVGTPMGVYSASFYIGSGVALTAGGFIVTLFAERTHIVLPIVGQVAPWQATFIATGLPGVVLAFAAFLLRDPRARVRTAPHADRPAAPGFVRFLRSEAQLVLLTYIGFGLAAFVAYAVGAWTPAYFARVFGMRAAEIGWTWGLVVALSGAFGALAGGALIDRVYRAGVRDACIVVPTVTSILCWPFLAGAYFMATPTHALVSLAIGMALFSTIAPGSYATWQRIAPPELRGRVMASFSLVAGLLGTALGPVVVALLTDRVLHSEARVGESIAITVSFSLPTMAILLFASRKALRRLPE